MMSSVTIGTALLSDLHHRVEEEVAEHKGWYFLQSTACVLTGVLAILLPIVTTLSFEITIGALLAVNGLLKALTGLGSHIHWWSYISAASSVAVGFLMLWQPASGFIALATLVAVFLLIEGLTGICLGLELESVRNWGWLSIAGVISLILSGVLFFGWPGMTLAVLSVMIGVNLLFYGASLFAVSAAAPRYEVL